MTHDRYDDNYIADILRGVETVAVVGASVKSVRPSYFVVKYLIDKGFTVFPVNPGHAGETLFGQTIHGTLSDIPAPVDMVDVFRNSEAAMGVVDEALELDPQPNVIWMQLSVRNDAAAEKAEAAGLKVVMNRCPKIEYGRLSGEIGWMGVNSRIVSARKPARADKGFQNLTLRSK